MPGLGLELKAGERAAPFRPEALWAGGGAGAWFDPADAATLFQDASGTMPAGVGDPVGRMADKSGNGWHAVQPYAGRRPTLARDGGGRACLRFDGAGQTLLVPAGAIDPAASLTLIVGAARDGAGFYPYLWGGAGDAGALLLFRGSDGTPRGAAGQAGGGLVLADGSEPVPEGAPAVFSLGWDRAGGVLTVGVGGVEAARTTGTAADLGVPARYALGSQGGQTGFLPGRIYGALLVGRRLRPGEAAGARTWMGRRCGA